MGAAAIYSSTVANFFTIKNYSRTTTLNAVLELKMFKNITIKKSSGIMIVLLAIQYLLGIVNNLFVKFPDTTNEEILWRFAWNQISVALHIILGLGLLVGSVAILIKTLKSKAKNQLVPAWMGFLSILVAFIAGALFVDFQKDVYSFIMAVFFITAILTYSWAIYKS